MNEPLIPSRERQALAEVGHTEVRPAAARAATLLFLLAIVAVPVAQLAVNGRDPDRSLLDPLPAFGTGLREAATLAPTEGLLAANRRLLVAIDGFENQLEEQSLLRDAILPWGQWLLTRVGGVGNEQAYLGREGWLFYRPDVDHVTGPGFLEPRVLAARSLGGEAWEERPQPDPLAALVGFARELEARGIELLVVPAPGKASIHPEKLSRRVGAGAAPVRNTDWDELATRLETAGLEVFDVGPLLVQVSKETGHAFLAADTHWTPAAMERVAEELGERLRPFLERGESPVPSWVRREAAVEGRGDIAAMLRLPLERELYSAQRVLVHPMVDTSGRLWRPERGASVLLLGDSFTNVFSDPALGWGSGAGLAEQLTWFLGRPVDRIAQNAGGAYTARQQLARELAADPARLDGVRVVVYQFAERELSFGDWKLIELPVAGRRDRANPTGAGG